MHRVLGAGSFVGASLCALLINSTFALGDIELFVSPTGTDSAVGSAAQPLATLAGAQSRLRELRKSDKGSGHAHVWIAEGVYHLDEELEFTQLDNAPAGAATVYEALDGGRVVIRGGVTIPHKAWQLPGDEPRLPESSRSHVCVVDLTALDVDKVETKHPRRARHHAMQPVPLELFCGEKRLPVAGWPNSGWANIELTGTASTGLQSWNANGLRPVQHPTAARAHGFWQHDWQDSCEPVVIAQRESTGQPLNAQTGQSVSIDKEHSQHVPAIRQDARFRIENLLSELDAPGEWYHDPVTHQLFAWLPEGPSREDVFLSTLDTPISLYDCERLTLRGLTIEGARASCIEIAGGKEVGIEHCQLRHAGNLGVHIYHGQQHRVAHCEITSTGAGAIRVDGGHRETLLPCDHVIEHNRLHDYAQLQLAYRPAVNVYGVGVSVRHNSIFDAPHAAIVLHGNEHVIEYNEIHHVCRETDDVGAIYLAHNPTYRGNVIRHNHIHDLGGFSRTGVIGIYLDDFASGTHVSHNVLERTGRGIAIGGGRDNIIENNLILDCLAAVQIDCRGTTWAKDFVKGNRSRFDDYLGQIEEFREIYTQRYPELATLMDDSPELAKGNRIERNLYEASIGIDLHDGLNAQLVEVQDNFANARSLVIKSGQQFEPRSGSAAELSGFQRIDLLEMEPDLPESKLTVKR